MIVSRTLLSVIDIIALIIHKEVMTWHAMYCEVEDIFNIALRI